MRRKPNVQVIHCQNTSTQDGRLKLCELQCILSCVSGRSFVNREGKTAIEKAQCPLCLHFSYACFFHIHMQQLRQIQSTNGHKEHFDHPEALTNTYAYTKNYFPCDGRT